MILALLTMVDDSIRGYYYDLRVVLGDLTLDFSSPEHAEYNLAKFIGAGISALLAFFYSPGDSSQLFFVFIVVGGVYCAWRRNRLEMKRER